MRLIFRYSDIFHCNIFLMLKFETVISQKMFFKRRSYIFWYHIDICILYTHINNRFLLCLAPWPFMILYPFLISSTWMLDKPLRVKIIYENFDYLLILTPEVLWQKGQKTVIFFSPLCFHSIPYSDNEHG